MSRPHAMRALMLLCSLGLAVPMLAQQDAPPPPPQQGTASPDQQGPPPGEGRGGRRPPDPQRRLEMMQRQLNLSADQTAQLKTIFADGQSKMEALRANTSLAPQDRHSQAMSLRDAEKAKVDAVLTPDQQKKWAEMQQRQRERMEQHGGRRGGGQGNDEPPPPPPSGSTPPQQ